MAVSHLNGVHEWERERRKKGVQQQAAAEAAAKHTHVPP